MPQNELFFPSRARENRGKVHSFLWKSEKFSRAEKEIIPSLGPAKDRPAQNFTASAVGGGPKFGNLNLPKNLRLLFDFNFGRQARDDSGTFLRVNFPFRTFAHFCKAEKDPGLRARKSCSAIELILQKNETLVFAAEEGRASQAKETSHEASIGN